METAEANGGRSTDGSKVLSFACATADSVYCIVLSLGALGFAFVLRTQKQRLPGQKAFSLVFFLWSEIEFEQTSLSVGMRAIYDVLSRRGELRMTDDRSRVSSHRFNNVRSRTDRCSGPAVWNAARSALVLLVEGSV